MKLATMTRMLWVLVMAMLVAPRAALSSRESRKEPNLLPVPLGVNLLGRIVSSQEALDSLADHAPSGEERRPSSEVEIDYDYFLPGASGEGARDPFFGLDRQEHRRPPNPSAPEGPSASASARPGSEDAASFYDYYADGGQYPAGSQGQDYDAFSVFYDSMFPDLGAPVIPGEEDARRPVVVEPSVSPARRPTQRPSTTTPATPSRYMTTPRASRPPRPSQHAESSRPLRLRPSPFPRPETPASPPPGNSSSPASSSSSSSSSSSPSSSSSSSSNASTPIDMSHLKAIFPMILKKFGLPLSLADDLFRDEAALQATLLQITRDESFKSAVEMFPQFNIPGIDFANLPKFLSDLDPSMVMTLLPLLDHIDFSHITDLLSRIGIDMSYFKGILNRGGAAAQYGVSPDGEDDSKFIYIPLLDTGSVNNVQIIGFVVVMFFLVATAYAYMEYGLFDNTRRQNQPKVSSLTSDEILSWADGDLLLPAIEATEAPQHWHTYAHPAHNEVAVSWYSPPAASVPYPEEQTYPWGPAPAHQAAAARPHYRPGARPRPRPKAPSRRRPARPYAPRPSQRQPAAQRRRTVVRRRTTPRPYQPAAEYSYEDYDYNYNYNDDYYYYDDHYDDYYYDAPPQRLNRRPRPDRGSQYYYPTTPLPAYSTTTRLPDTTAATTPSASPASTTTLKTWTETRPTSKYAETIRTVRPPYKTVDDQDWARFNAEKKT